MSKLLKKNYESIRDASDNNQKNKQNPQNHTTLDHHENFIKTIVPFPTPTFWVTLIACSVLLVLISGSILFGDHDEVGKKVLDFAAAGTSMITGLFGIASVILLRFYPKINSEWLTKRSPPKEFKLPEGTLRLFLAVPFGIVLVFALFSLAVASTGKGESDFHVVCCVLEILFINALVFHWLLELGYIPIDAPSFKSKDNNSISKRTPTGTEPVRKRASVADQKPDNGHNALLADPEGVDTSVSNDNISQITQTVEDKDFTVKIPREHLLQRCVVFTEIVLCSWVLTFYCAFTKQIASGSGFIHSVFGTILAYYIWKKIFPMHWYDQEPDRNESTCYGRSGTSRVLYGLYSFFCIILVIQLSATTFMLLAVSSAVGGVSVSPLSGVLLFIMFYGYWKVATLPRTKFDYTNEIATIDTWYFVKSGTGNESHHMTEEKLMYVAVVPLFVFFGLIFDGFAQVMLTSHRLIILKREAGFYGQEQVLAVHELEDLDSIRVEYGYPWATGLYSCNPPCCLPPLLASGKNVLDVSVPIPEAYQDQLLAVISTQINALRFRQRHAALARGQ